jgi:caspase domain-containing protein
MARSLSQSGYEITVLGVPPDDEVPSVRYIAEEASRSRCLDEIGSVCLRVPEGGTLLVYFSGHGVRIKGADFLVPRDFSRLGPDGKLQASRLVPVNFSEEAALCRAKTLVCFVDACRNSTDEDEIESGEQLPTLPVGSFVLVRGCEPGQTCAWQADQGSVFTRALASALQRNQAPRTLGQVLQATRDRLKELDSVQRPHPVFAGPLAKQDDILDVTVCEGVRLLDDWRTAVITARLWTLADESEAAAVEKLRTAVRDLVSGYGSQVGHLRDQLADISLADGWTDDGYPGRILEALYLLLTPTEDHRPVLRAAEVATLIAAPFLREAVLALGLHSVKQVDPRDFSRRFGAGLRGDLENVFTSHEQLTRRAAGLAESSPDDRDALAMWLVHRWILEREDLWEGNSARTSAVDLARAILIAVGLPAGEGRIKEQGQLLLTVIRCLTTVLGPDNQRLEAKPADVIRARPIGYLLSIAGVLGADPRRMSGAVADHIGTRDAVGPGQLREALATEVRWRREGTELIELDAVCGHPAVHVSLAELVAEADAACGVARHAATGLLEDERVLLAGVPARCAENLRPEGAAYSKPLLRFHLAGDRVRDLLMGSQLYGDNAAVAVREISQNALDACRYRHMRLRCEYRTETPPGWQGRITLRQGTDDESGRRYIECEDNGVGMTESVLRHVFTSAGTRFVHTEEFRREEARWRQVEPTYRLYPNSQFGIGVFSYFMLADEVSVWTVATDEHGLGMESRLTRLHIHIPGHGGLFRLRRDEPMPEGIKSGGTTVRLYLSGGTDVSVADALTDYLVVSTYQVDVWKDGALVHSWLPDVPQLPLFKSAPGPGVDRVWWVDGTGGRLCDGLVVGQRGFGSPRPPGHATTGEACFGWLIDLTGSHQPRLSVDRTKILDWDRSWVTSRVRASVSALAEWPGFTWQWMWSLMRFDLSLAQAVYEHHADRAIPIDVSPGSPLAKMSEVGCFPDDARIFEKRDDYGDTEWPLLFPWRAAAWQQVGDLADDLPTDLQAPVSVSGFPVLTPADFEVLTAIDDMADLISGNEYIATVPSKSVASNLSRSDLLYRLRRLVIAGFDLQFLRDMDDGSDPQIPIIAAAVANRSEDVVVPLQLLQIAFYLGRPLADIAERFRRYAASAGCVLPEPGGPDLVPTMDDLRVVSEDFDGVSPWRVSLSEADIGDGAVCLKESVESVRARCQAYRRIGFGAVPLRPPDPPIAGDPITETLSDIALTSTGMPSLWEIHLLAWTAGVSELDAYRMIVETIQRMGLPIPGSPAVTLPSDRPTEADHALMDRCHRTLSKARALAWIIRDRREHLPEADDAEAGALYERNAHLVNLPRRITPSHLVLLSADLGVSVGHAAAIAGRLFPTRLEPTDDHHLSPEVDASLRPFKDILRSLAWEDGDQVIWSMPSTAFLVQLTGAWGLTIGEMLAEMQVFRPFGAELPDPDVELAGYHPDAYDASALEVAMATEADSEVTAMRLLRVAGRFGWTVSQAFDRLNRFRSLGVNVEPSREQCPDVIVHWADVIVLSEYLDGEDPALFGPVSVDRIERAADAVREAPAETRARLLRYAELFRLQPEDLS